MSIPVTFTTSPKQKPAADNLGFGKIFTDHMFIVDYSTKEGWHDGRIVPYEPITLDPASKVFHYGQAIFEGLKAYITVDGDALLFRPDRNFARLNHSAERLCIPAIDEAYALEALKQLVDVDREWIPTEAGTSLYIRPFVIATEADLGVDESTEYKFMIIMSPSGSYYAEGINPVKIMVENKYVRAVVGGTGEAKTSGNYASSLISSKEAHEKGYAQTLWLDGKENKYVEEVGSMNIFFKINGTVITPKLTGSILPGITRDSMIQVLKQKNIAIEERNIAIDEVIEAHKNGTLEEVFGTGTAAVISPVGRLLWEGEELVINNEQIGDVSQLLYDTLTGIQSGALTDEFNWTIRL